MFESSQQPLPEDIDLKTWRATRSVVQNVLDQLCAKRVTCSQKLVGYVVRLLGESIDQYSQRSYDEQCSIVRRIAIALERARRDTTTQSRKRRMDTRIASPCDTHTLSAG